MTTGRQVAEVATALELIKRQGADNETAISEKLSLIALALADIADSMRVQVADKEGAE